LILHEFLHFGADPNIRDGDGNTPLHVALLSDNPESRLTCIKELLIAGANVHAKNNAGLTPLDIAKKGKNSVVIKMLMDAEGS